MLHMLCVYLGMITHNPSYSSEDYLSSTPESCRADFGMKSDARTEEARLTALEQKAAFTNALRRAQVLEKCRSECPVIRMMLAGYNTAVEHPSASRESQHELAAQHGRNLLRLAGIEGCNGHTTTYEPAAGPTGETVAWPVEHCSGDSVAERKPAKHAAIPDVLEPVYT